MIRAKCDVSVELDRPNRQYAPGEQVGGVVRVTVDGRTKCDALTFGRVWRTHGKGNRQSGAHQQVVLYSGEWQPGTYTYPFEFPCPNEPTTYHGKLLNVDWYLDARADVPWAIDAKGSSDFFVVPGVGFEPEVLVTEPAKASPVGRVILVVVLGMFGLVALGGLISGLMSRDPGVLAFGVIWTLILGIVGFFMSKKFIARKAFSRLDTRVGVAGTTLTTSVDYVTSKRVHKVTAKLMVREVVVRGSGTDRTTYRHTVHKSGEVVPIGHVGQSSFQVDIALPDPRVVGWSFAVTDNELEWYVSLDFDVEGWPDLEEVIPLVVRPRFIAAQGPYRSAPAQGHTHTHTHTHTGSHPYSGPG